MKIEISEALKIKRKMRGLNETQVAEEIGICRAQYGHIENGRSYPSMPVLIKLLKYFDLSFEQVYPYES